MNNKNIENNLVIESITSRELIRKMENYIKAIERNLGISLNKIDTQKSIINEILGEYNERKKIKILLKDLKNRLRKFRKQKKKKLEKQKTHQVSQRVKIPKKEYMKQLKRRTQKKRKLKKIIDHVENKIKGVTTKKSSLHNYLEHFIKQNNLPKSILTIIRSSMGAANIESHIIKELRNYIKIQNKFNQFYVFLKENQKSKSYKEILDSFKNDEFKSYFLNSVISRIEDSSVKQELKMLKKNYDYYYQLMSLLEKYAEKDLIDTLGTIYVSYKSENIKDLIKSIYPLIKEIIERQIDLFQTTTLDILTLNYFIEKFQEYKVKEIIKELQLTPIFEQGIIILKRIKYPNYKEQSTKIAEYKKKYPNWTLEYKRILKLYNRIGGPDYETIKDIFFSLYEDFKEFQRIGNIKGVENAIKRMMKFQKRFPGYRFYRKLEYIVSNSPII